MSSIDLVFEGGGAKGMVFVGALDALFQEAGYTYGRLLGTSAGAITALSLAAGYTVPELYKTLVEKDAQGRPVFAGFLGDPPPFDPDAIHRSALRKLLADLNLPFVPDFLEDKVDDWIAARLADSQWGRHLFSFIERGGWYSADPFVTWMKRKLNEGETNGQPRQFGEMTLSQLHEATKVELTLVAADTTWERALWLNHRTAPKCPAVWAARMSMSVPLLWQEVEWQAEWGPYHTWDPNDQCLKPEDITGHVIVDGGLLSNFPLALFMADRPDVTAVVGPAHSDNVLGLLIDETLPVPGCPPRPSGAASALTGLRTVQRLRKLVDTVTGAHDNLAKAVFAPNVVRLPARGYGTTQFDMTDAEREALVDAGRDATRAFIETQTVLHRGLTEVHFDVSDAARAIANDVASDILGR